MHTDIPCAQLRTDAPAPSRTAKQDLRFFAENPHRRQRLRKPTWLEMRRARKVAVVTPLKPGQEFAVLVQRPGSVIITMLVKVSANGEGWPETDDDIDGMFGRPARPVTPGRIPA